MKTGVTADAVIDSVSQCVAIAGSPEVPACSANKKIRKSFAE